MSRSETDGVDRVLNHDLKALGEASTKNLPKLDELSTAPVARRTTQKEILPMTIQLFRKRPWLATAGAGAFIALILLVVPISYTKTTGQEVRLRLARETAVDVAQKISTEFGRTLHSQNVSFTTSLEGPIVTARVSGRSGRAVAKEADSFARFLSEKNIAAEASVRPLTETVSTSLLAYAADRILTINIDAKGRTSAEIEDDIRHQLETAGFQNPVVSVSKDGDRTQVQIHSDGKDGAGVDQMKLTVNGSDPKGNTTEVRIDSDRKMTDAEIQAEIERQLREKGVDAVVKVQNGQISIERKQR